MLLGENHTEDTGDGGSKGDKQSRSDNAGEALKSDNKTSDKLVGWRDNNGGKERGRGKKTSNSEDQSLILSEAKEQSLISDFDKLIEAGMMSLKSSCKL